LTVKDVDQANHKVTFVAKVSPEANVRSDGQPIRIDALKAGDQVKAQFNPATGEVSQLDVTVKGGGSSTGGSGSSSGSRGY
jgi:hypothetical protein